MSSEHYIIRVGNGDNFIASSPFGIYGVNSDVTNVKHFLENVKLGDRLWFIKNKSHGKVLAVATYKSHSKREFGPLIDASFTNEELGWIGSGIDWISDTEIHYTDLYDLTHCNLLTYIKGAAVIRNYNEKCRVELPLEYNYIVKYSKPVIKMIDKTQILI